MWSMISKVNHRIFRYQNKKWITNNNNFLNAMSLSAYILYEKYHTIQPSSNSFIYFSSVAFYAFDMNRLEAYSFFWIHHVLTISMLLTMQSHVYIKHLEIARNILCMFELGNLPIYLVCGMKTSIHKYYWETNPWLKISMVFEFVWFIMLRCIMPLTLIPKLSYLHNIYLLVFISASIKWSVGMFYSVIKQFSIGSDASSFPDNVAKIKPVAEDAPENN